MQHSNLVFVNYSMGKPEISRVLIAGGLAGMLLTSILLGFFFAELPTSLIFWICGTACFSPVIFAAGMILHAMR